MHTNMPGKDGPPYAMMPSYITEFQSSPVRIYSMTQTCLIVFPGRIKNKAAGRCWHPHYLKHGEQRLREVVERAASGLVKVKFPSKELHAKEGEDDDEEEEQEQQGSDGADGVEQRSHQVGQRVPVSVEKSLKVLKEFLENLK